MNLPIPIAALNPDIPLKKHSATIHVESKFSTIEHKLLNILYKSAFDVQQWQSEYYYIRLSDIKNFIGRNSVINIPELKKNLENLRTAKISWNIFNLDQENEKQWDKLSGATGFISSWVVAEGPGQKIVRFSLSPEIKKLIEDPKVFSYIDLQVQKKLSSKYDIVFFELLSDELNRSQKKSIITRWYSIGDLRRIHGIPLKSYLNESRDFNRYCIKGPIAKINEHSDLEVDIQETEKVGKKAVAFRFSVTMKGELADPQESLDFPSMPSSDDVYTKDKDYIVMDELIELFYQKKIALDIYDDAKTKYRHLDNDEGHLDLLIKENIEYSKRQKNVKNLLGYMRAAIENDYACYEAKLKKEKEDSRKATEQAALKKKQDEEKRKQDQIADDEYNKKVEEFNKLPANEISKFYDECREKVSIFSELPEDVQRGFAIDAYFKKQANQ